MATIGPIDFDVWEVYKAVWKLLEEEYGSSVAGEAANAAEKAVQAVLERHVPIQRLLCGPLSDNPVPCPTFAEWDRRANRRFKQALDFPSDEERSRIKKSHLR